MNYYEQLYGQNNKISNLGKMDKVIERDQVSN